MGPTASGKTGLAMQLTEHFPFELVSVDSAQVFCDMDLGTSKPDSETLEKFPHHLINLISPEEAYSAARFRQDALAAMQKIIKRGNIPLLVGGSMLYFKALFEGLAELPQASPTLRAQIDQRAETHGWPAIHAELAKVDPQTAARLKANDSQRIQRALEVFYLTGETLSTLLKQGQQQKPDYDFLKLGLRPQERAWLHERIASRFEAMLDAGLQDEVKRLRQKYVLSLNLPSMRCVGYRQVFEVLDGITPPSELRDRGIFATRQLSKRQATWMANTLKPIFFDCQSPTLLSQVQMSIGQFLQNP